MTSEKDATVTVRLNIERDKTLRELQTSLPWTIRYSRDYRANPQPHKDFTHALVHVSKALGKLMGLADDMDHDREVADNPKLREEYGKYVADLVVCALRASNVFPGGVLDLQKTVQDRITDKNSYTKYATFMPVQDTGEWPVGKGDVSASTPVYIPDAESDASGPTGPRHPIKGDVKLPDFSKPPIVGLIPGDYAEGSLHWNAYSWDGTHMGTFWAPLNAGYQHVYNTGSQFYPGMHHYSRRSEP